MAIRAEDVYYEVRSEADHSFALTRLNEILDIIEATDVTRVMLTITLRMAIDDAYKAGMDAGYY